MLLLRRRDALTELENADMNFIQAKRHFRAVQQMRGYSSPGRKGKSKKGKGKGSFGKGKSGKGFGFGAPRPKGFHGKGSSLSSSPAPPDDGYYGWHDDGWSADWSQAEWQEDAAWAEDAMAAGSAAVRCSDCSRLGHPNASDPRCPRHSKGRGKRGPPRRKGGGKGPPRPNRMAIQA